MSKKKKLLMLLGCALCLGLASCKNDNQTSQEATTKVYKKLNSEIDRVSPISNGKIIVEIDNKYGIQDLDGKIIENIEYDKIIRVLENCYYLEKAGMGVIKNIVNNKVVEVNEVGKISEEYLKIMYNNKVGVVDKDLNWVIPMEYDYLEFNKEYITVVKDGKIDLYDINMKKIDLKGVEKVLLGIGNYLYNVKDNKLGIMTPNGDVLVEPKYNNFLRLNEKDVVIGYKGNEKYLINLSKKIEKLVNYDSFGEEGAGLILTLKDNKLGYINDIGEKIIPNKYEGAFKADSESEYLQVKEDGKWKLIYKDGKLYKELPYNDIGENKDEYTLVLLNDKFGYMDKNGDEKITPQYLSATSFEQGYAIVGIESGFGIINKKNEIVIPMIYDDIYIQSGYVYVTMDNKKGLLDLSGNEILPVAYDDLGAIDGNVLFYKKANESGYMEIGK